MGVYQTDQRDGDIEQPLCGAGDAVETLLWRSVENMQAALDSQSLLFIGRNRRLQHNLLSPCGWG